jgi:hypothetical protein
MYAEHLIGVGRRSVPERVAHFPLKLLTRLQTIGLAEDRSYHLPLTQGLIGDALGLSVPHVSRTLKQLRKEDLVTIEGQRVVIKDVEALSRLADFERAYLSRFHLRDHSPRADRRHPAELLSDPCPRPPSHDQIRADSVVNATSTGS